MVAQRGPASAARNPWPKLNHQRTNGESMAEYLSPGVYVQEVPTGGHPIDGVNTSGAGGTTSSTVFIDVFQQGPLNKAVQVTALLNSSALLADWTPAAKLDS